MTGLKKDDILRSIEVVVNQRENGNIKIVDDYDIDNFSSKVTRVILSYINYVNRIVWKKHL